MKKVERIYVHDAPFVNSVNNYLIKKRQSHIVCGRQARAGQSIDNIRIKSRMSQVDLKSYEAQLVKARDSIITNTTTAGYVIFGYAGEYRSRFQISIYTTYLSDSGASNSLMVEEYGEGGLEELVTEFHCGRYQYGLVGVNITNRGTRARIYFEIFIKNQQ